MRKISILFFVPCVFCVLLLYRFGWSQTVYPPTIKVPVTFYDFHADGTNPDFEPGLHTCGSTGCIQNVTGLHSNEAGTTLDAQRKPILGTTPFFSDRIAKWFRPWQAGDFTIPVYSNAGAYLRDTTITTDTSYKNMVFPDSLTFTLVAGSQGVYTFNNQAFFPLDGRGFGAEGRADAAGNAHNFSFAMELHWEFTYQTGLTFNFTGDDDVFVFINGQRVIDLGGIHGATNASVNLNTLGLTVGTKYMFDLFYCERHVVASDILITTNVISANPALISIVPSSKDTIPAGTFKGFTATVTDDTGGTRHEFDPLIHWSLTPTGTSSSISATAGGADTFFARQAYTTYIISASYVVSSTKTLFAYDTVYVTPGPDYRAWIEPDANINPTDTSPPMLNRLRHPDHDPLVQMSSTQVQDTVYGVIRDFFGNFTRLASNAVWSEVPITGPLITAANGTPPYVGLINRINAGDSGTTNVQVSAKSLTTGADLVPDTTRVVLFIGYITNIKFVNVATNQDITSVNINTDQDITIKVMGILSTDLTHSNWIDITGVWKLDQNPFASVFPLPATDAGQWHLDPTKPGQATLSVTTGSGNTALTGTLPITVTVAPPDTVFFTIVTPPESLIAGQPIRAIVSIYNHDGLVPGVYCYPATSGSSAIYQDSLGKGNQPDPTVKTDEGNGTINTAPSTASQVGQCFNGGLDTVTMVLYRAPYSSFGVPDTNHQLVVVLGPHSATTGPFKLLPGTLTTLQIEDVNGRHLTGTDSLAYPSGAITVYSVGYDIFGNKIGRVASNWSVNGTLHQPGQTQNTSQLYYDASQVTTDESGTLYARALRNASINDSTGDSLGFFIKGPPSELDSAVTRDVNGNGYLDEIELYFGKPVSFPPGFSPTNITLTYTVTVNGHAVTVPFTVSSITPLNGDASGTKYVLYLAENTTSMPGSPQTAWRPFVSIVGMENPSSIPPTQCKDGAGPVIWSVTKTIVNVSDRKQDVVQVTFSEPIQGPNGSPFSTASVSPAMVLVDYRKNADGTWDTINIFSPGKAANGDTLYINSFSRMVNDSTLEFVMTNGKDLTTADYLNINPAANRIYDNRSRTTGGPGVGPVEDNQKVPVKVINNTPNKIIAVPNPSGPNFTRPGQQPGRFSFVNNPLARDWVRQDRSGTVITFDLSPPKAMGDSIAADCRIFDVIGNVVTQADTTINYNSAQDTATAIQYDAYWNGSNSRNMRVAPGLYSTLVTLMYYSATKPKQVVKMWGVIGIAF